jgi:peptide chain release factor 2
LINEEYNIHHKSFEEIKLLLLLNKPYDKNDCILEIHSGAGGTEACDWANMLYRMYLRFIEKKGYKADIVSELKGEETGIKSVSIIVKGTNAYGYLKNEKGVHRLVRLSPFDSSNRRHTSFASVMAVPVFDNDKIDIEIKEEDIRVDVYRSSGKGGQGVNTTDSAVRITHLESNIVVTCQNERSQIKNKETAMKVLKSKLFEIELSKKENLVNEFKEDNMSINFGSQIRSYVMHPYSLVKDHRTNTENTNVTKVLDGDIDEFINVMLKNN